MHTTKLLVALLVALLGSASLASTASAQLADDAEQAAEIEESPVWFGLGAGYLDVEARLGFRDALGEDASLRVDAFASMLFPVNLGSGGGVSVNALWTPGEPELRGYLGAGLELSVVEAFDLCLWNCDGPDTGVYAGANALAGVEAGSESVRFFAEVGVSVSARVAGDQDASMIELRPRVVLGVNLL